MMMINDNNDGDDDVGNDYNDNDDDGDKDKYSDDDDDNNDDDDWSGQSVSILPVWNNPWPIMSIHMPIVSLDIVNFIIQSLSIKMNNKSSSTRKTHRRAH